MIRRSEATANAPLTIDDGDRSSLRKAGLHRAVIGAAVVAGLAVSTGALAGPSALPIRAATVATRLTSATGDFSSPGLDTDEAFSRKFTAPGTYTYFCALHPHMTATIIVK